jgi:hypothetical protein
MVVCIEHLFCGGTYAPIVRATLANDHVLTCSVSAGTSEVRRTNGGGRLWIESQGLQSDAVRISLTFIFGIDGPPNELLRWQCERDEFHCVCYSNWPSNNRVSRDGWIKSVSLSALKTANRFLNQPDFWQKHRPEYEKAIRIGRRLVPVLEALGPFGGGEDNKKKVFFDVLCRDRGRYELFVTHPIGGRRLTCDDFDPDRRPIGIDRPRWS